MAVQTCVECHFLVLKRIFIDPIPRAQVVDPRSMQRRILTTHDVDHEIDEEWRREIGKGKMITGYIQSLVDDRKTHNLLGLEYRCSREVWSEELFNDTWEPTTQKCNHEILAKERKNFCFYFPCRQGMRMEAAQVLQERESEQKLRAREKRSIKFWIGIAIAVIGADIYLRLANHFEWWPF